MSDSIEEFLLHKIQLGEDSLLDFKRVRVRGGRVREPERTKLAEAFAAMANARGGRILLGIDDDRSIDGIELGDLDAVELYVRELANDSITPPLPVTILKVQLPDATGVMKNLVVVEIDRSLFIHQVDGRAHIRIGSSNRVMTPEHYARLQIQRSQARVIRFDEQIVPDTTFETLHEPFVERFRTELSEPDLRNVARKLDLVAEDFDGTMRATVAGIVMSTKDPRPHMPNAFVQAVAYRAPYHEAFDDLSNYQRDERDITGPLDQQVRDALSFVDKNMTVSASKSIGRSTQPQYDLTAIFEALVNAVAHRDYAIHGSKVRLRLYADRLVLHIPGDLPNSMDVDSLPLRQASRNETITSLLARTPVDVSLDRFETPRQFMMDRRGEGVNQILLRSEKLSGRRPTYEMIGDGELVLTIFAAIPSLTTGMEGDEAGE